jgi:hypothetical protein
MHLDYLSCALTVVSTFLVGRRNWTGLIIAAANSLIVCDIGWKTAQIGLIPANLFCLGVYAFSIRSWMKEAGCKKSASAAESAQQEAQVPMFRRILAKAQGFVSQNKAASQESATQNELPTQNELHRPIPFKSATATANRVWAQHHPRRRQNRSATAWNQPGVYSRAAAR